MAVLKIRDNNGKVSEIPALKGSDGKSAYEIAVVNGFEGTEEEWLESLGGMGELTDAAIKERHIADGAVGADKLMDISVGTRKIIDGAVTEEKLDPTFKDTLATKSDLAHKANENDLRTAESNIAAVTGRVTDIEKDIAALKAVYVDGNEVAY